MSVFVAAVPIFDSSMTVEAYKISAHNSDWLAVDNQQQAFGEMLATPALDLLEEVGINPFAAKKPLLVDVNQYQLLMDIPLNRKLDVSRMICIVDQEVPTDEAILEKCRAIKKAGGRLAYSSPRGIIAKNELTSMMDYYIVEHPNVNMTAMRETIRQMSRNQYLIVERVSDMAAFLRYGNLFHTLYCGEFYSQLITMIKSKISPVKLNILNLMREMSAEDVDLIAVARTIERDPALSVNLLRFINSPAVNVRRHIESIRGAVVILGQKELRRWVTVALSVGLAVDRPSEITRLSLVRAKFAENLATVYNMGAMGQSLFMMGLFSMVDVILQKPMSDALREISVEKHVSEALVDHTGILYDVLDFVCAYERANWDGVMRNMLRNRIDPGAAQAAYVDALQWYTQLLDDIDGGPTLGNR